jgi:glycosyltransferase involved in cell wall biosynthesis
MFFSPYCVDDATVVGSSNAHSRQQAREALGIPESRFVFIMSGKLIPRKDPLAVLQAIRLLRDRDRVGLIVLGDGELKEAFVRDAKAILGERFVYPGFVNQTQIAKYFAASDALVMPSRFETWGLVVNEAMHHGLPCVVSSQVGCAPDLVHNGQTGFVYPSGDLAAMARSMQRLIDDQPAARVMGEQARCLVEGYTPGASARGVLESLGLAS